VVFGRSLNRLEQGADGVAATFVDGARGDYALVFGCDGNRSNTRRLAFADADDVSHFMGGYFFIKVVATTGLLPSNTSQLFSVPGRTALLNGYDDRTDIARSEL
jgi:2-polyprenyl-6-methoxyphenol hydroxylase-like FAD-dependent oxidoreductase